MRRVTKVDGHVLVGRDPLPYVVVLVACLTGALWLVAGRLAGMPDAPLHIPWYVLAVAFAVVEVHFVHLDFRDQSHAVTLSEVPLLLGLAFTAPGGLVLARVVGGAAAVVGWWRLPPRKAATNLVAFAAEAVVAVVVHHALRGDAPIVSPRGWLAAAVAVLAGSAVSHGVVLAAIRATTGVLDADALRALRGAAPIVTVANCCAGLVTILVLWRDPAAVWLLAGIALLLVTWNRSHGHLRRRYADLDRVHRFTEGLQATPSAHDALRTVLLRTTDVVPGARAELLMSTGTEVRRFALGGERTTPDPDGAVHRQLLHEEGFAWRAGDDALDAARSWLVPDGARDAVVAPVALPGERDVGCALVVADRLGKVASFDADDLTVLRTVANHAAAALGSGRLMDRLRREVAEKHFLATHDPLTELINRVAFAEAVRELATRTHEPLAVVVLDVDGFKQLNDALGYAAGDDVLLATARQLVAAAPRASVVARLGGDEFAVALPAVAGAADAVAAVEHLLAAVHAPLHLGDAQVHVTATAGIALAPAHGTDPEQLLQRADVAMYTAQRERVPARLYEPEHDRDTADRLALVADLRAAIDDGALELHYQPKVRVEDRALTGVEALVRWRHPQRGFLPPAGFVPLAEQAGLVRALSTWVLREAVRQAAAWRREGLVLTVAVNLSPRDVTDPSLVDDVRALLDAHGVPAAALTVEITESSVLEDVERSLGVLHGLSTLGVKLSVDDFGTGYSSLAHVKNLPVDEVKVDRAFVAQLVDDPVDGAIVGAVLGMARDLGLSVVAEGVEDEPTLQRLDDLRCDLAQGYHLSRPLPADALTTWARAWPAGVGTGPVRTPLRARPRML